jgi:hypothetical protein
MRWLKNLFYYGGSESFWVWLTLAIVGAAIAGSVWALHCDVKRLVDVLERTNCTCTATDRVDSLLR